MPSSSGLPRRTFLAVPLAAAAVGVASCGFGSDDSSGSDDNTPEPSGGGSPPAGGSTSSGAKPSGGKLSDTFRQANRPVNHLDPRFGGGGSPQSTWLMAMMWEGLVRRDPDNTENYLPGAAEKWDISDDGLTYTFHLRADAKWSNGEAVTANDFVWSYQQYYSPDLAKLGFQYSPTFNGSDTNTNVKGLPDYYAGKTKDFSTVGIKASDDHTLVFTLTAPDYRFVDSTVRAYPLYQKSVEAHQKDFWFPANFVGNGPYKLTAYKQNGSAKMVLSDTYWDAGSYSVKTREIQFNASGSTGMMVSYNADEIDLFRVDGDPTALIAGRNDVAKQLQNGAFVQFKGIEVLPCDNPILQENPKLRQALAMAVDREALASVSPPDVAGPSWVPSGITGADKLPKIPFDPDQAKQLLSDAGFPNGKGVPTLQILTYATMPVLEAVGSMWKKNLNINAKVSVKEVGVYSDMLHGNLPKDFVGFAFNYQAPTPMMMMRYGGTHYFNTVAVPAATWRKMYNINYGSDKNKYTASQASQMNEQLMEENWLPEYKEYVKLADEAVAAQADLDKATEIATEAAKTFQETYLWIPLLWAGYAFMVKPRVHDLKLTSYPDDMISMKGITLDPVS